MVKKIFSLLVACAAGGPLSAVEPETILRQTGGLRPEVLELALEAYEQAEAEGAVKREVLTIVDYELPSHEQRLWVIDIKGGSVLWIYFPLEEWLEDSEFLDEE
jgi:hypothetical protein